MTTAQILLLSFAISFPATFAIGATKWYNVRLKAFRCAVKTYLEAKEHFSKN